MPENSDLELLSNECSRALRRYLTKIKVGCRVLSEFKTVPIPDQDQRRVVAQRREEDAAYRVYMNARRKLWRYLTESDPALPRDQSKESPLK